MNKIIFGVAIACIALLGCTSREKTLGFKRVVSAEQTDNYKVDIKYPRFVSDDRVLTEKIAGLNSDIERRAAQWRDTIVNDAGQFFSQADSLMSDRPAWKYELKVSDTVFMATDRYVSVRLTRYYFTGGAHGMTDFYTLNYDLRQNRALGKEDIFDMSKSAGIDLVFKEAFAGADECFNTEPTIAAAKFVNISPTDICITYEQYALGPYSCGYYELIIPRSELKGLLKI